MPDTVGVGGQQLRLNGMVRTGDVLEFSYVPGTGTVVRGADESQARIVS